MSSYKLALVPRIGYKSTVRVKETGHITEIMYSEKSACKGCAIKKLSGEQYVLVDTGEVKDFSHTRSRADDLKSISRSLAMGRDLINTNVSDVSRCRWVTLTYAENMTDCSRLYSDTQRFVRGMRKVFGSFEYITAAEPQGRGAWHQHMIMIFPSTAPYLENSVVASIWRQGFVNIQALNDIDNIGAYLSAYLGDVEVNEPVNNGGIPSGLPVKETDTGKKYIKGARMYMYPPQFHIFRWSKGIKKPVVSSMSYLEAKEKVRGATQTFSKGLLIADDQSGFSNTLIYEYYNDSSKKSQ